MNKREFIKYLEENAVKIIAVNGINIVNPEKLESKSLEDIKHDIEQLNSYKEYINVQNIKLDKNKCFKLNTALNKAIRMFQNYSKATDEITMKDYTLIESVKVIESFNVFL